MRTFLFGIFYLVMALMPVGARADLLADIRQSGTLRVAFAVGIPQFSFLDAEGNYAGSDYDTAVLLARDLDVKLVIVSTSVADRVKMLETKQADVVISALSITPERERKIDFSLPYARIYAVVAGIPSLSVNGYADLAHKQVGVTSRTASGALIEQFAPQAVLIPFDEDSGLIQAAVDNKLTLVSTQQAVVDEINRRNPKLRFEEKFVLLEFDEGIALPKHEKGLRDYLNKWVSDNLRNGKLNDIFKKHHGRNLPADLRPKAQNF